jgi:large subunit ribosomal protein L10
VNRTEKIAEVEYLKGEFKNATNAFLVGFSGLSVLQADELRQKVREAESSFRVVKNRLAKRALAGSPLESLADSFTTSTAVAYNDNDPVGLAKALADFAKDNPALTLRTGIIDGRDVLDTDGIERLAKLPSMPEMRAQLLSLISTPATQLVRLLGTPTTELARVIDARRIKLEEDAG